MASIVHLHRSDEADLVVEANGPLAGAHVANFWILRPVQSGYAVSMTAMTISTSALRSNGKEYQLYKNKLEDIKQR